MSEILEILTAIALVIGGAFTLVGSYGLVKLSDPMARLHAPTKASTLGVGAVLAASVIYAFATGAPSVHELLIMAFLFVTAPVSAYFISKVHVHQHYRQEDLPACGPDDIWATKQTPQGHTPEVAD